MASPTIPDFLYMHTLSSGTIFNLSIGSKKLDTSRRVDKYIGPDLHRILQLDTYPTQISLELRALLFFKMHAIQSLVRWIRSTSLDRMTYTSEGTFGLPVEIWQSTFKLACMSIIGSSFIENEFGDGFTSDGGCMYESAIPEFDTKRLEDLFKLRLTLVQVCKSWYFMAIQMLRSHIRVKHNDQPSLYQSIHHSITYNPLLATTVVRLTVVPAQPYEFERLMCIPSATCFESIAKIMPNLQVLVFSYHLDEDNYLSMHPRLAMIYKKPPLGSQRAAIISENYDIFGIAEHVRHYFPKLSTLPASATRISPTSITFTHLVNLVLRIEQIDVVDWVTRTWVLPKVRLLSITSRKPYIWTRFITRCAPSLERLELLLQSSLYGVDISFHPVIDIPAVTMPKLKVVCMHTPSVHGFDQRMLPLWREKVRSPVITHFCFHARDVSTRSYGTYSLSEHIEETSRSYPSLETIGVFDSENPTKSQKGSEYHQNTGPSWVPMPDIARWCGHGLTIELNSLTKKDVFTKKVVSEMPQ